MALDLSSGTPITFQITSQASSFPIERRFASNIKIVDLKSKLELITGASSASMTVKLMRNNELVVQLDDNQASIENYLANDTENLGLHVSDVSLQSGEFDDVNKVEKFELEDEEYAKREDTVRAFKIKNKLGRFGEAGDAKMDDVSQNEKKQEERAKEIKVGDRVEIEVKGQPRRRGSVMFVGETKFQPGIWIGVKCDEPLGKNDGSVGGHRYFQCPPKYGSFVRPLDVKVGDYPEEGMDLELDEM